MFLTNSPQTTIVIFLTNRLSVIKSLWILLLSSKQNSCCFKHSQTSFALSRSHTHTHTHTQTHTHKVREPISFLDLSEAKFEVAIESDSLDLFGGSKWNTKFLTFLWPWQNAIPSHFFFFFFAIQYRKVFSFNN